MRVLGFAGLLAGPYLLGLAWAAVSWPADPVRATLCALAALAPLLLLLRLPAGPLVGYAAWGGPVITLLGAIGIAQARILARRSSFGFAEVEQDFLDAATDAQWLYGVLLGVAAALLVAASVLLHLRGADGWGPGLLAAGAVLQTAVLLMSTVYTPF
ncbi:MAG: hypothetical protein HOY71_45375, partial [Nonomuraea sp.]|nr:hypothetical protein [Nonomuraea sp.]